jgi:RNA polymerase sigma-70 factor (ECF subfamily)
MNLEAERLLIEQAKIDPESFGVLFDNYYQKLLGYTVRRTGSVVIAEDIVAEAFMSALKGLPKFRWQGVSIEAWLYRIVGNQIRMHFRKSRPMSSLDELYEQGFELEAEYDLVQEAQEAQEKLERRQDFMMAQRIIASLPIEYQEVLVLRYAENKKIKEISEIVGKREGTIKSLLSRGLALLRKELDSVKTMQPTKIKRIVGSEGRELSKPQEGKIWAIQICINLCVDSHRLTCHCPCTSVR